MAESRDVLKRNLFKAEIVMKIAEGVNRFRGSNRKKGDEHWNNTLLKSYGYRYRYNGITKRGDYYPIEHLHDTGIDNNYPNSAKTIERAYKELVKDKIVIENERDGEKYCQLNLNKIVKFDILNETEQERIKTLLLENNDFESYRELRSRDAGGYYSDKELETYQKSVRMHHTRFKTDEGNIERINAAMLEHKKINIKVKNKIKSIIPLCYVINRDETECYLYYCKKGKVCKDPIDVKSIELPISSRDLYAKIEKSEKEIDYNGQIDIIKDLWDAHFGGNAEVVLYVKNVKETDEIRAELKENNWQEEDKEDHYILKGYVYGLDGFKRWLRSRSEYCFILEPQELRDYTIEALEMAIKNYEDLDHE